MYGEFFRGENLPLLLAPAGLFALAAVLLLGWYGMRNHTARIYNWNGKRYRYLGRARLYRDRGGYRVQIGERMADLSDTTLYQICPSRRFVRRNRYRDLVLCAGDERCALHIDGCMRKSVYYRKAVRRGGRRKQWEGGEI